MESALPDILGDDIMDFQEKTMIESDIVALFAAAFDESAHDDVDSTTNAGARRMRVHGIYM